MRLIDADALLNYIDVGHLRPPSEACFSELDVKNMIDKSPTIDAVEAVRCKDCEKQFMPDCPLQYIEKHAQIFVCQNDNDYCSYGERKEDK